MIVWWADKGKPVNVHASLNNEGLGWFALELQSGGVGGFELVARALHAPLPGGEIQHQFSVATLEAMQYAQLNLRLRVLAANPSASEMTIFLTVSQGNDVLPAVAKLGQPPINGAKGKHQAVPMTPALKQNVPDHYDFKVWYN